MLIVGRFRGHIHKSGLTFCTWNMCRFFVVGPQNSGSTEERKNSENFLVFFPPQSPLLPLASEEEGGPNWFLATFLPAAYALECLVLFIGIEGSSVFILFY